MARVANHPATSLTFLTYLFFSLSRLHFILSSTLPSSFLSLIILASLAFSLGIFFHISHFTFCPFSSPYSFLYSLPASLSSLYSSHFSQVSSTLSHAVHWQNYEINEWHPSRGIIQNIKPPTSPWDQIFVGRSILIKIKLAAWICVALCSTIFQLLAKFGLQNFFKKILNYWNYFIFYLLSPYKLSIDCIPRIFFYISFLFLWGKSWTFSSLSREQKRLSSFHYRASEQNFFMSQI